MGTGLLLILMGQNMLENGRVAKNTGNPAVPIMRNRMANPAVPIMRSRMANPATIELAPAVPIMANPRLAPVDSPKGKAILHG